MTDLRRRRVTALLVACSLVAVLAGCSGSDSGGGDAAPDPGSTTAPAETDGAATTEPDEAEPVEAEEVAEGDDLYAVPEPLPDAPHGTLLRYQAITPTLAEGAESWRVMYLSESLQGEPIAVTGTVIVPTGTAPDGGWPVLTLGHGTTGIADECAPSKDPRASEMGLMGTAVDRGWMVAMSDYEGLGTPGRHPYLVGPSQGRGVVDAVLAADALPGAERSDQVMIAGYSQGGHAALWANEVAGEWAPELDVVGTFAGAPATEIDVILGVAPTLPAVGGFVFMIVAGYEAAYPEADPALFLTDAGVSRLDAVDTGCTGDVFDAVSAPPAEELIRPDGAASEPWAELAAANNPGQVAVDAPVLIIHSDGDQVVPVGLTATLEGRMCEGGQAVERRVVVGGGGHVEAAPAAYLDGLDWLEDLLAGGEPASSCPTG